MIYYDLTDTEWNALMDLSSISHMDCWFNLQHNSHGDYVYDNENKIILPFEYAVGVLIYNAIDEDLQEIKCRYGDVLEVLENKLFK